METGISLMELDFHSLDMVIFFKLVQLNKLACVVTKALTHHLVCIIVIFQQMTVTYQ